VPRRVCRKSCFKVGVANIELDGLLTFQDAYSRPSLCGLICISKRIARVTLVETIMVPISLPLCGSHCLATLPAAPT
jgi:hypothetical protein